MSRFFKNLFRFLLLPIIVITLLTLLYIILDPFKVIYHYDKYSFDDVTINRDYISTQFFIQNNDNLHYNSFILGSSRSMGYNPQSWKRYLNKDAVVYSYDAFSETIFGISEKLSFLNNQNVSLDNALILIDPDEHFFSADEASYSYLDKKHPAILGNTLLQRTSFQLSHLAGYLHPRFFISYFTYKIAGKSVLPYNIDIDKKIEIDYPQNWMNSPLLEERIKYDTSYFDSKTFYERLTDTIVSPSFIHEKQKVILEDIHTVLELNNTNYRVIVNPLYDQRSLNSADLRILDSIFGKDNVFNYSGKNQITDNKRNYYEKFHFRPIVGDSIMNNIYK